MRTTEKQKKRPEPNVPGLPQKAIAQGKAIAERYRITLWREDGEWFGEGVEEPGAMGDGKTLAQCVRKTRYAMALAVASHIADGEPVVTPLVDQEGPSGRKAG